MNNNNDIEEQTTENESLYPVEFCITGFILGTALVGMICSLIYCVVMANGGGA